VLTQVPYLRPPQILLQLPRPVPNDVLDRLYRAAEAMDRPRIPGLGPTAWWRCLLVIALNCGLRSETLFLFSWEHVFLEEGRLAIPAEFLKTRRPIILPLSAVAVSHLESIRGHAERVFPWPHGRSKFYIDWHRLHDQAGIPRPGHYKLKQVRKSLASLLWESDPAAAQLFLGHSTDATTKKYYVSRHILDRAMRALPQPAAFTERIGGNAT
jgi:integrase